MEKLRVPYGYSVTKTDNVGSLVKVYQVSCYNTFRSVLWLHTKDKEKAEAVIDFAYNLAIPLEIREVIIREKDFYGEFVHDSLTPLFTGVLEEITEKVKEVKL